MAEDWFRVPDWDAAGRAEFERRLARARAYNRPQYMRIKGLALAEAGEIAGARELWQRVLASDDAYDTQKAGAREHLADSYIVDDPGLAADLLRDLIDVASGTTWTQHIKLAELMVVGDLW